MTPAPPTTRSRAWVGGSAAVLALVAGLTLLGRYRLVEPMALVAACERGEAPWLLCALRQGLVVLFVQNVLGMGSTVLGVWSTITRARSLAVAAVALGLMSVILFRFDAAFIGITLGLLVLARALATQTGQLAGAKQQHQSGQP